MGFRFELVLADSLYGEKTNFVDVLDELKLPYILAIRTGHALWLPQDQEVYQKPWQTFERTFSNGTTETRYMALGDLWSTPSQAVLAADHYRAKPCQTIQLRLSWSLHLG